jgi:MFS family permease
VQWLGAAYMLPFALLLITGGRLGDIAGRKRVFLIGVAGFGVASAACALASDVPVLIGWRAVQGATASLVIPQTFGLIRAMFDGPDLARRSAASARSWDSRRSADPHSAHSSSTPTSPARRGARPS